MLKKFLIAFGLLLTACGANAAEFKSFMPENDLWKQDVRESLSGIDEVTFNKIINAALEAYKPMAAKSNETLVINNLWSDSTVNANACRGCARGQSIVNMYGGLARREEIKPEGFALVLCHELGHLYSGAPYISPSRKMSGEGQADYSSTYECLEKIYNVLDLPSDNGKYALQKCEEKFGEDNQKFNVCIMGMSGGLSLGKLLAVLNSEEVPQYETPDKTVVSKTELSYPRSTQCRLDSYGAGALKLSRPLCWFKN